MVRKTVTIVGAGAWGTALANLISNQGYRSFLWAFEEDCADSINQHNVNPRYLPEIPLNPDLTAVTGFEQAGASDVILAVVPAQFMRPTLKSLSPFVNEGTPIILCSKGIELGTLSLMTEVLSQEIPQAMPAVLSGPSFAKDVAIGLPTAVTLATANRGVGLELALLIGTKAFRPYLSNDLIGAEIGGSVKNVLAIAAGIVLGLDLGRSAHAALISRGFAEMTRLGMALGADASTLTGLCGFGDLILTCSSEMSRNMSCGFALGQGQKIDEILKSRSAVTEGVASAPALVELGKKLDVDMPICEIVYNILYNDMDVSTAVDMLLGRPLRFESSGEKILAPDH